MLSFINVTSSTPFDQYFTQLCRIYSKIFNIVVMLTKVASYTYNGYIDLLTRITVFGIDKYLGERVRNNVKCMYID